MIMMICFKETGCPLPPLHNPAIDPYFEKVDPVSNIATHLHKIHLNNFLPSGFPEDLFPSETLYAFLDCSMRATCLAHLRRLDIRFLIM